MRGDDEFQVWGYGSPGNYILGSVGGMTAASVQRTRRE